MSSNRKLLLYILIGLAIGWVIVVLGVRQVMDGVWYVKQ